MKYRIYDNQFGKEAFNDIVFETRDEGIEYLLSYFSVDHSEKRLEVVKYELEQGNDWAELYITVDTGDYDEN